VLTGARRVAHGTHRFGHLRAPAAVVASAGPNEVAFENPPEGNRFGPWSFLIASDNSVWLLDELNRRLLVWPPGQPNASPRPVPLGSFYPIDFALGAAGSIYVTEPKPNFHSALCRLTATGQVLWETMLATRISNNQLRVGPDGKLYWTGGIPNSPRTERSGLSVAWAPVASPDGRPFNAARQRRTLTMYQPLPGGQRLVWAPVFEKDWAFGFAPHEERIALINRAGRVVRAWRIMSRTAIWPHPEATPALLGRDLVVVLSATSPPKGEYVVLRLAATPSGTRARFSLPSASPLDTGGRAAFGDVITDVRIGPGAKLYQLGSSPTTGVAIYRYSLAPA
jgi:hypothetical protein